MQDSSKQLYWVEDAQGDRELIKIAFEKAHFNPDEYIQFFVSGEELLNALESKQHFPKLIVLDISLPGISGIETLRKIRQSSHHGSLPVIIFSGSINQSDIHSAYSLYVNGYIEKPGNFVELISIASDLGKFWLSKNLTPELMLEAKS